MLVLRRVDMVDSLVVDPAVAAGFLHSVAAREGRGSAAVGDIRIQGLLPVLAVEERMNLVASGVDMVKMIVHKGDLPLLLAGEVGSGVDNHVEFGLEEAEMNIRNPVLVVRMAVRKEQMFVGCRWENHNDQLLILGGRSFVDARMERDLEVARRDLKERMAWAFAAVDVG